MPRVMLIAQDGCQPVDGLVEPLLVLMLMLHAITPFILALPELLLTQDARHLLVALLLTLVNCGLVKNAPLKIAQISLLPLLLMVVALPG